MLMRRTVASRRQSLVGRDMGINEIHTIFIYWEMSESISDRGRTKNWAVNHTAHILYAEQVPDRRILSSRVANIRYRIHVGQSRVEGRIERTVLTAHSIPMTYLYKVYTPTIVGIYIIARTVDCAALRLWNRDDRSLISTHVNTETRAFYLFSASWEGIPTAWLPPPQTPTSSPHTRDVSISLLWMDRNEYTLVHTP